MIKHIANSFRRKFARRFTREYKTILKKYNFKTDGAVSFLDWDNPLAPEIEISQSTINFFRKFIKKGDLVIDIGANIGDTTLPMAIAAGKEGTALAFDPNPFVFKILRKNANLNSEKTNIQPYNFAVTCQEDTFYFISSNASFANGGISSHTDSMHGSYVLPDKIRGIKLSEFLKEQYPKILHKLSFIKVDTEGYDKEILKSISDLIAVYKPVIIAESFGKAAQEDKIALFDIVSEYGYELHYFKDFLEDTLINPIRTHQDMLSYKETMNFYAVPK